jgi:hypothetical protein
MMSSIQKIKDHNIWTDLFEDSTCTPRIELSIRENDIGQMIEVMHNIQSTEVVKDPVILGSESKLILA